METDRPPKKLRKQLEEELREDYELDLQEVTNHLIPSSKLYQVSIFCAEKSFLSLPFV